MRRSVGGGLTRGAAPRSGRLLWTKEEWKLFWTLPSERASEGDDEDSLPPSSFHSQSHTQMSGRSGRPSTGEGEGPRLWVGWWFVRSFVRSEEEEEVEPVITVEGTVLFRGRWAGSPQTHGKKEGRKEGRDGSGSGWTDAKS